MNVKVGAPMKADVVVVKVEPGEVVEAGQVFNLFIIYVFVVCLFVCLLFVWFLLYWNLVVDAVSVFFGALVTFFNIDLVLMLQK